MKNQNYTEFLKSKEARVEAQGIEPGPISETLFDWQGDIVKWALKMGRAAIFADCFLVHLGHSALKYSHNAHLVQCLFSNFPVRFGILQKSTARKPARVRLSKMGQRYFVRCVTVLFIGDSASRAIQKTSFALLSATANGDSNGLKKPRTENKEPSTFIESLQSPS